MKSVLALSFIISTRFFGLFIVMPVLSLYALELKNANEFLIGLLVGVYALMQIIFQVPFGILSDKIGRKKTMFIGLAIFIIGSLICANSNDIYTMIIGRIIQGSGAIGAVGSAMISDFVSEEKRGKAMAIMGGFIGIAFAVSMVLSPIMSSFWGLSSLFYLSAILSFICIIMLFTTIPKETKITHQNTKTPIIKLIKEKNLSLMNITNFMQKMLMSIAFLSIPIMLNKEFNYPIDQLWHVYLASMIFGFLAMGLAGSMGERRGLSKNILLIGIVFFAISYLIFAFSMDSFVFMVGVVVFFIGFNLHEPIMQSCASKFCKVNEKGAALGIFNAFGYGGSFVGGIMGGYFLHHYDFKYLAFILIFLSIIWFVLLLFLKNPRDFSNLYLDLNTNIKDLSNIDGIIESYKNSKNLVIKYDNKKISKEKLESLINTF